MQFKLGQINFSFKIYKDIREKDLFKLFSDIEIYKDNNNLILINSYIFTSYKNNQNIINFTKNNRSNLIYSRENNKFNVQLLFIKKSDNFEYENIKNNSKNIGINIKNDILNILFLNGIAFDNNNFIEQTKETYELLFTKYKELGYEKRHFVKAWNFIEDILDRYKDFNLVRDKYFKRENIGFPYPAGTGIDCRLPDNMLHSSSYFLLNNFSSSISIKTLNNTMQCEASDYGPKFSRAKLIKSKIDNNDILLISGTAAVDNDGKSIFIDNIEKNINYTLESFNDLLKQSNMDFDNIVSAFVYIKSKKYYKVFLDIYKENNFKFPYIYNFCNICRDDFLFEIEGIAVKQH